MTWLKKTALSFGRTIGIMLVISIIGTGLLYWWTSRKPHVADGSTLYVELDRPLVEAPAGGPSVFLDLLSGGHPPELTGMLVADAVRAAATDKRIARVVLDLDGYQPTGSESVQDLVRAVGAVRATGKPVIAYASNLDRPGYLIAAAAQKAYVSPLGSVDIAGPEVGTVYVGDLLKKLGVEVRIAKAGRFKSAVEPFELGAMSDDARASLQYLMEGHRAQFLAQTAAQRGTSTAALAAASEGLAERTTHNGGDLPQAAIDLHLIDGIATPAALENFSLDRAAGAVPLRGNSRDGRVITIDSWQKAVDTRQCPSVKRVNGKGGLIAIVPLIGTITMDQRASGQINPSNTVELLRKIRQSPKTAAVVLRIDSPGGDAQASEIIRSEIVALRQSGIPVVASLGNIAASGGYWIATAADTVVAGRFTTTGSIGAFAMVPNLNGLATAHGINPQIVRAGPVPIGPGLIEIPTDGQLTLLDAGIAGLYGRFVGIVADARHLSRAQVEEIAQGRVWTGPQAVERHLADRVGTLEDAIAVAAKAGNTSPDCKALLPRPVSFQQALQLATGQHGGVPGLSQIAAWAAGIPLLPAATFDRLDALRGLIETQSGRPLVYCAACEAIR